MVMSRIGPLILSLLLLVGCLPTEPDRAVSSGPHFQSFVEIVQPRQNSSAVKELLGEPERIDKFGDRQEVWVYAKHEGKVYFLDDNVYAVVQEKGEISEGIRIGDSEDTVLRLGYPVVDYLPGERRVVIDKGDGELHIYLKDGVVVRFVRSLYIGL